MRNSWSHIRLGDACDIINGRNQKAVEDPSGAFPIYGSGGIMGYANSYLCKGGSTIIGRKGTINRPLYVDKDFWNVDTAFGLSPKAGIAPRFLFYLCKSINWLRYNKSTTLPSLVKSDLLQIPISVPGLEEQHRIVDELDLLSDIIRKKNAQLRDLDILVDSLFYEMFGEAEVNQKGFPLLTVDDVIQFQGGSQPDKKFFEYEPTEDNVRLIQIRDYKTDRYITYVPKELARRFCTEDDIMIGRYGPPIFQILKGISGAYNVALMKAVPKQGNKDFIRVFLRQKRLLHYLESFSRRVAGQDGIQMDKLKAYPFPFPPMELQNRFAKQYHEIEKQKLVVSQSMAECESLLSSRMSHYFD